MHLNKIQVAVLRFRWLSLLDVELSRPKVVLNMLEYNSRTPLLRK